MPPSSHALLPSAISSRTTLNKHHIEVWRALLKRLSGSPLLVTTIDLFVPEGVVVCISSGRAETLAPRGGGALAPRGGGTILSLPAFSPKSRSSRDSHFFWSRVSFERTPPFPLSFSYKVASKSSRIIPGTLDNTFIFSTRIFLRSCIDVKRLNSSNFLEKSVERRPTAAGIPEQLRRAISSKSDKLLKAR